MTPSAKQAHAARMLAHLETTMTAAAHTPLPWEVVEATENHGPYITTAFGTTVCDLYAMTDPHSAFAIIRGETKARPISHTDADLNAALIVRAVNSYQDMLDALRQWQRAEADNDADELANARFSRDEAIAKATAP